MTPAHLKKALCLLALCGAASCSLMVDFDLEGKPCGNDNTCLEGYVCIKNACWLADEDAGATGKKDGGAARDAGPVGAGDAAQAGPTDAGKLDAQLGPADV
ncbi:MAG: hypothetical protein QM765_49125 [Myxococcales bacterium]